MGAAVEPHGYPSTKEQRCGVHKTANITGAMPKPMHEKAKVGLQDIWMAETKKEANAAFDLFVETYGIKYERVVKKLTKDRGVLRNRAIGTACLNMGLCSKTRV